MSHSAPAILPPELTTALAQTLFDAARGTVPAWSKCEWCGTALVAGNGPDWLALAPVQVWFAPEPDEEDADDEARALWTLPRFGTALLVREGRDWRPTGRVLFNIAPANAPERLGAAWRLVGS